MEAQLLDDAITSLCGPNAICMPICLLKSTSLRRCRSSPSSCRYYRRIAAVTDVLVYAPGQRKRKTPVFTTRAITALNALIAMVPVVPFVNGLRKAIATNIVLPKCFRLSLLPVQTNLNFAQFLNHFIFQRTFFHLSQK